MAESQLTVHVDLSERSYDVHIGTGNVIEIGDRLRKICPTLSHVVLIADQNVETYARMIAERLLGAGYRTDQLFVAPGEASKSVEVAGNLWNQLVGCGTDRKSMVAAVGGGVVGDLAGFVAATFARGLPICQVPTTLLSQVDSSVGGKTGVNLPSAKNMVGAFWQPSLVVIDTDVLSSLPHREYLSGLAEVVKYGVILDEEFFVYLEGHVHELRDRESETLRHVIARSCQLKANVVQADERETSGLRAVLNYGHTFAHALEAVAGYGELLHGEAVAIGMVCASRLAEKLGRIPRQITHRQIELLQALELPIRLPPLREDDLWQAMGRDKKVEHGQLRFVLPDRLGHVELVDGTPKKLVIEVLAESR